MHTEQKKQDDRWDSPSPQKTQNTQNAQKITSEKKPNMQ